MIFRYSILYVADVARALDVYERAFGFRRAFLHDAGDYGELDTGETKLAFSSRRLMTELGKSPGIADPGAPVFELAFETDDVPAALARALSAGARLVQEVREEPWGQTTSYVSDPDGYLVEICSPVATPSDQLPSAG
jgi:catechol 2,3-dioxygenase-like lactoylglutathione lyase family enzyme